MTTLTAQTRASFRASLANPTAFTEIKAILEAAPGGPDGDFGSSGTAGSVDIFPATTARGKLRFVAANSAGDTTTTITNASQSGARTYTVPDAGASASFVMTAGTQSIAAGLTVTSPIIATGLTASGSAANTFAGSTGTFITSTGANTLSGAVTVNDATTPSITCASGKTNTGFVSILGKTSGGIKILPTDAGTNLLTITNTAQTVGTVTLTIPDFASVADTFAFITLAQTFVNKTLTAPSITGMKQDAATTLTAVGSNRATSLALTNTINNITSAAASTGVTLPAAVSGNIVVVNNLGANAIQVYGAGSDTIDGVAAATGVPLTNTKRSLYVCVAAATWISLMGVASA